MQIDIDDLDDARKAIKHAWIAGLVSGGITFVVATVAISSGGSTLGGMVDGWAIIDALVLLGLTYGVYRKNRAAAVGLLGFYLLNQVIMRIGGTGAAGIGLALVFTFFFVQGVRGTFAYHKFTRQKIDVNAA